MNSTKKKYYTLDDLHFIGDSTMTKRERAELDKKTREFFSRRRAGIVTKKKSKNA